MQSNQPVPNIKGMRNNSIFIFLRDSKLILLKLTRVKINLTMSIQSDLCNSEHREDKVGNLISQPTRTEDEEIELLEKLDDELEMIRVSNDFMRKYGVKVTWDSIWKKEEINKDDEDPCCDMYYSDGKVKWNSMWKEEEINKDDEDPCCCVHYCKRVGKVNDQIYTVPSLGMHQVVEEIAIDLEEEDRDKGGVDYPIYTVPRCGMYEDEEEESDTYKGGNIKELELEKKWDKYFLYAQIMEVLKDNKFSNDVADYIEEERSKGVTIKVSVLYGMINIRFSDYNLTVALGFSKKIEYMCDSYDTPRSVYGGSSFKDMLSQIMNSVEYLNNYSPRRT